MNTKATPDTVFRTNSKKAQPFARSRPYTEVKDSHARYYAMHDRAPTGTKVAFKDADGRRYRIGPIVPGGLQRLFVKLPKGVPWFGHTGQSLDLHPVRGNTGIRLTPTLAYAFIGGGARRSGYVDVRGWWWEEK